MLACRTAWVPFLAACALAQGPAKVDFARDVQPILRQNCVGCHGAAQQMNGFRLDRKSSVFKAGMRRVVPGSPENSFLMHRVTGNAYGLQMPPTGPLKAEEIATLKAWIEQGANWPDALANEVDLPPLDPKAVALVEQLRAGDRQGFRKAVTASPKLLNARGPEGSTPFLYAVLYADGATLEELLKKGADPNLRNDTKATALMWAANNLEKTRILVQHGADVNAVSDDNRTPLMIAAGHPGGSATVKFLLDHGAKVNPNKTPFEASPLTTAALATDAETVQLLLDHGAESKVGGGIAMGFSVAVQCQKCVDILAKRDLDKRGFTQALLNVAGFADPKIVRVLLDGGADVKAFDPLGRTALMYAAVSELMQVETVKLLIERGADVNARSRHQDSGDADLSVLDIARLNGDTPIVDLLIKAGAKSPAAAPSSVPNPRPAEDVRAAIQRAIPQLQHGDAGFTKQSGCVSCHNNSIAAMAFGAARKGGIPVDERTAAEQVKANAAFLEHHRDTLHQGTFEAQAGAENIGDLFGPSVLAYILVGLDAEHYKPDLNTDAVAMYLKSRQTPEGRWAYPLADSRQPLGNDYIGQTALSMRALQLYAPNVDKAEYARAVRLAASWIAEAQPRTMEDRLWRLQGLAWAGRPTQSAMGEVLKLQRPDGAWSDLPTSPASAYTTGRALVALQNAGLAVSDTAYQRGVRFLLNTQTENGAWFVRTRALALQPFFDSGFPHGVNQAISAAGTAWATMALALAK